MSRCFRATLPHRAEAPEDEEVAEGPLSKSDSNKRRIDVAAVGNMKPPFATTLAGTAVPALEPEGQLPLF